MPKTKFMLVINAYCTTNYGVVCRNTCIDEFVYLSHNFVKLRLVRSKTLLFETKYSWVRFIAGRVREPRNNESERGRNLGGKKKVKNRDENVASLLSMKIFSTHFEIYLSLTNQRKMRRLLFLAVIKRLL